MLLVKLLFVAVCMGLLLTSAAAVSAWGRDYYRPYPRGYYGGYSPYDGYYRPYAPYSYYRPYYDRYYYMRYPMWQE